MASVPAGLLEEGVWFRVEAAGETHDVRVTRGDCPGTDRPLVGINLVDQFPFDVQISSGDVGGGYEDRRLSDIALRWMQEKAAATGLGVTLQHVDPDNYRGTITDSYDVYMKRFQKHNPRYFRKALGTKFGNEAISPSIDARRRAADIKYQPQNNGLPPLD